MNVTTTVEGLERYPVNLRYSRELRDDLPGLRAVLVPTPAGPQIPLGRLASIEYAVGPPSIKSEGAKPNAWVYVDLRDVDVGTYVERARAAVADRISLPPGYTVAWSGQYEYMQRAERRLALVIPLTLLLIAAIIYASRKSVGETLLVLAGAPFALTGAVWLLYALDYNLSIAVWVGVIALAGLYAETATVLLLYLDLAMREQRERGLLTDRAALARRDPRWHGATHTPDTHDDRNGRHRAAADHVEHRRRRRRDEAHRGRPWSAASSLPVRSCSSSSRPSTTCGRRARSRRSTPRRHPPPRHERVVCSPPRVHGQNRGCIR